MNSMNDSKTNSMKKECAGKTQCMGNMIELKI